MRHRGSDRVSVCRGCSEMCILDISLSRSLSLAHSLSLSLSLSLTLSLSLSLSRSLSLPLSISLSLSLSLSLQGVLREAPGHSRTAQESPRGVQRAPGGAGSLGGALEGKATIFACYVQRIRNIDENLHDMHSIYAMSDDVIVIFARVNFKSGHSTRE